MVPAPALRVAPASYLMADLPLRINSPAVIKATKLAALGSGTS